MLRASWPSKFTPRPGAGRDSCPDAQRVIEKKVHCGSIYNAQEHTRVPIHHQQELPQKVQNHAKLNNDLRIHTREDILSKSNYIINTTVGTGQGYDREEGWGTRVREEYAVCISQLLELYYYLCLIKVLKHSYVGTKCFTIHNERMNYYSETQSVVRIHRSQVTLNQFSFPTSG